MWNDVCRKAPRLVVTIAILQEQLLRWPSFRRSYPQFLPGHTVILYSTIGGWPTFAGFAKVGTNAACVPIFHPRPPTSSFPPLQRT
jgi:hypothetical protein